MSRLHVLIIIIIIVDDVLFQSHLLMLTVFNWICLCHSIELISLPDSEIVALPKQGTFLYWSMYDDISQVNESSCCECVIWNTIRNIQWKIFRWNLMHICTGRRLRESISIRYEMHYILDKVQQCTNFHYCSWIALNMVQNLTREKMVQKIS